MTTSQASKWFPFLGFHFPTCEIKRSDKMRHCGPIHVGGQSLWLDSLTRSPLVVELKEERLAIK